MPSPGDSARILNRPPTVETVGFLVLSREAGRVIEADTAPSRKGLPG